MSTINGNVCVVNGNAVDKVFSNGKQVYGRNLLADSGFESGNTPANYFWNIKDLNETFQVIGPMDTFPVPMGKFMLEVANFSSDSSISPDQYAIYPVAEPVVIKTGETWTYSYYYASAGSTTGQASDYLLTSDYSPIGGLSMGHGPRDNSGDQKTWHRFVKTWTADRDFTVTNLRFGFIKTSASPGWVCIDNIKLEKSSIATPWTPAPEDILK